jgi:hypothetical protein
MPSYKLLDTPFYGIGLKMYDALAGKAGLGSGGERKLVLATDPALVANKEVRVRLACTGPL